MSGTADRLMCTVTRMERALERRQARVMPFRDVGAVEGFDLEALEGRVATTLFVVYPPGIATIVPGERLSERARPMIEYLKMFERGANLFPGFESEIQGLYREPNGQGSIRFYTYVMRE